MTKEWKFEDIDWSLFDPKKVDPEILRIIKAGSVVEHNGADYGLYLKGVFKGDDLFGKEIEPWAQDEIKHGRVLAKWIKLADPSFDFEARFKEYIKGFPIQTTATESIRGSRAGELLSRCMVEIGTSSLYRALRDATDEPLLKHICKKIAADELRHYKLFYTHLMRYQKKEKLNLFQRLKVGIGRILENEDDELAYAYYASNGETAPYDRTYYTQVYATTVYSYYKRDHVNRGIAMLCKAVGLKPQGWIYKSLSLTAFKVLKSKERSYKKKLGYSN